MHKIRIRLWCNKSFLKFYLPFAFLYSKFSKFTLSYKKNILVIEISLQSSVCRQCSVLFILQSKNSKTFIFVRISSFHDASSMMLFIAFRLNFLYAWLNLILEQESLQFWFHDLSFLTLCDDSIHNIFFFNFKDFILQYTIMLHKNLP